MYANVGQFRKQLRPFKAHGWELFEISIIIIDVAQGCLCFTIDQR